MKRSLSNMKRRDCEYGEGNTALMMRCVYYSSWYDATVLWCRYSVRKPDEYYYEHMELAKQVSRSAGVAWRGVVACLGKLYVARVMSRWRGEAWGGMARRGVAIRGEE